MEKYDTESRKDGSTRQKKKRQGNAFALLAYVIGVFVVLGGALLVIMIRSNAN